MTDLDIPINLVARTYRCRHQLNNQPLQKHCKGQFYMHCLRVSGMRLSVCNCMFADSVVRSAVVEPRFVKMDSNLMRLTVCMLMVCSGNAPLN